MEYMFLFTSPASYNRIRQAIANEYTTNGRGYYMEEMKRMLREVLREELGGIEKRLDNLELRFDALEHKFDSLEQRLDIIEQKIDRIEGSQVEDVLMLLKLVEQKINEIAAMGTNQDNRIEVLNDRLFKLEADVRKVVAT
jgi:chromosome segregation ATPase